ncbi:hypothetical protein SDC9_139923 [bioreactor metagenome]|uniref:Uncharacterized protein n=1 Tax=bioreactor metagenome TaxID=1076179 RepID=A0A645DTU7_9ZZZZ
MAVSWNSYPEIFTDADVVSNTIIVKKSQPLTPYKLSVSKQTINTINTEQADKTLHKLNAFRG